MFQCFLLLFYSRPNIWFAHLGDAKHGGTLLPVHTHTPTCRVCVVIHIWPSLLLLIITHHYYKQVLSASGAPDCLVTMLNNVNF